MAYSCNNNQNYFIQNNRSTSRVLQPPGGASSLSFCLGSGPSSSFLSPEHKHKRTSNKPKPAIQAEYGDYNDSYYRSVDRTNDKYQGSSHRYENDVDFDDNSYRQKSDKTLKSKNKSNNSSRNKYDDGYNNNEGSYPILPSERLIRDNFNEDDTYKYEVKSERLPTHRRGIRREASSGSHDYDDGYGDSEARYDRSEDHIDVRDTGNYRSQEQNSSEPSRIVASGSLPVIRDNQFNSKKSNSSIHGKQYSDHRDNIYRSAAEDAIYEEFLRQKQESKPIPQNTKGKGPMPANAYAALLSEQIEEKKRLDNEMELRSNRVSFIRRENDEESDIFGGRKQRNKNRNGTYIYESSSNESRSVKNVKYSKTHGNPSQGSRQMIPSIKVHAPPGGSSSFSLY